ncbi:MAG: type VI secretion system TssO [Flavobacteriales bacterium]
MQINITLSKKEKRHYFLYLIGMLFFTVLVISLITLGRIGSPFSEADYHSEMVLQEKIKFDKAQNSVQKVIDSTFTKLDKMDPEKSTITEENQIEREIGDINSSFVITDAKDPRQKAYTQVAKFYRMYFEDKKSIIAVKNNTELLQKEYEDCSVGYKDKQQAIRQRENAIIMRQRK